ncbi:hypothetical protein [Nitrobacter vulgaris]|uniref:hypothetical protein n=1 Tax=Nitrobacter vulgaris TaxID=29421 RepID=UPI001301E166|nr:hypothetical protein [Nitrobacter vulgaris]
MDKNCRPTVHHHGMDHSRAHSLKIAASKRNGLWVGGMVPLGLRAEPNLFMGS